MAELIDLDALDAELDDIFFTIRLGGRTIDFPNMAKQPVAMVEEFQQLTEAGQYLDALCLPLAKRDREHIRTHLSLAGAEKLGNTVATKMQTILGTPGED